MSNLFSFQGKVYLGDRSAAGKMTKPVWMGDAKASLKLTVENAEHTESFSGQRLPYGRMQKSKSAELTLTLFEWTPESISLGLYAATTKMIKGTVTAEVFPTNVAANDVVMLENAFVSDLVLTDSKASTPTTLVEGTDYQLESAASGMVKLLQVTSLTQPIKAAYSYAAASGYAIFSKTPPEKYFLLDGVNTENDSAVLIHLYRTRFDPLGQLDIHTDDYGQLQMSGAVLYDPASAPDPDLGGFGRIVQEEVV